MMKAIFSPSVAGFTIETRLNKPAAVVFDAYSDIEKRKQWFCAPKECVEQVREMDFKVGGHERLAGLWPSGVVTDFRAKFHFIEEDKRIVSTYDLYKGGALFSTSLACLELIEEAGGTLCRYTETSAYFDETDIVPMNDGRKERTQSQFDRLAVMMA